tara:strand:+ start:206 stop:607 length:402 start_codon:yes stop_codon:yes gene_type:complete
MLIDHIAIRTKNIDKMQKWYEDNLNAVVETKVDHYVRLSMENTIISLIDYDKYQYSHIGVLVDKWEDLPTKGVRTTHRDGTIGVYCFDPENNVIEYIWYPDKTEGPMQNGNKQKSTWRGILQKIHDWGSGILG